MCIHHRKLLHQRHYTMAHGPNSSPAPSPSPLESSLSPPFLPIFHSPPFVHGVHLIIINHNHSHVLRVAKIAMACMVGMLMFLCCMSIIRRKYHSRRHNHNHNHSRRINSPILFDVNGDSSVSDDDEGPVIDHPIWFIRTVGLQQSVIDSITVFTYKKDEGVIDGTECSVCLGEFQEDESLRLLPKCSHAFHIPCIDTWLTSHKNCPMCRAPVFHDAAGGVEVRATEPDSNVSGQNQETQMENFDLYHVGESGSSGLRIGDDDSGVSSSEDGGDIEITDKTLPNFEKMNCLDSSPIGSQEVEEEIQPIRRSVSMDSSSASVIFLDVVDLNSDLEISDDQNGSCSKAIVDAKQGSGSSTIHKLASIGRALQKRPISVKRSRSHNKSFLFSRHFRSQSLTLPL